MLERFHYQNRPIRIVTLHGEPWFVARDVCEVLEIGNVGMAVARLDDDERNTISLTDGTPGNPNMAIVNEPGLYSLILGSRKPEARQFKRWITHEVLPSIRQIGSYSTAQPPQSAGEMLLEMAKQFVEQEKRLNRIQAEIEVHKHRIDTLDHVDVIGDKQQRLNAMVRKYAYANGTTYAQAWREFRAAFNTAYRTQLTALVENYREKHDLRDLSMPEYLARAGRLDDALRVMDKLLNPVGV